MAVIVLCTFSTVWRTCLMDSTFQSLAWLLLVPCAGLSALNPPPSFSSSGGGQAEERSRANYARTLGPRAMPDTATSQSPELCRGTRTSQCHGDIRRVLVSRDQSRYATQRVWPGLSFGTNRLQPFSQTAAQNRLAFGSVNIRALLRIEGDRALGLCASLENPLPSFSSSGRGPGTGAAHPAGQRKPDQGTPRPSRLRCNPSPHATLVAQRLVAVVCYASGRNGLPDSFAFPRTTTGRVRQAGHSAPASFRGVTKRQ